MRKKLMLAVCLVVLLAVSTVTVMASSDSGHAPKVKKEKVKPVVNKVPDFFATPPPFSEGIFPCSQCHADMEANEERRELYYHTEIQESFTHAKEQRWCLDCHNAKDRDKLRLVNNKTISFEESYYLCGQCHGTIFRDWKAGIHGKRTGYWNGEKLYRLCVECHNPHSPKFKPLPPLPAPIKPGDYKYRKLKPEDIPSNPLGDIK